MDKVWVRKEFSSEEEEEAYQEHWGRMTGQERVQVVLDMLEEAWRAAGEPEFAKVVRVVHCS